MVRNLHIVAPFKTHFQSQPRADLEKNTTLSNTNLLQFTVGEGGASSQQRRTSGAGTEHGNFAVFAVQTRRTVRHRTKQLAHCCIKCVLYFLLLNV